MPLEERIQRVLSNINTQHIDEEVFVGNLEDFSVEEIRCTEHKLIVREQQVFIYSIPWKMHTLAVGQLSKHIDEACVRALGPSSGAEICAGPDETLENIPGFYGYCAVMSKCPDIVVYLAPIMRRHPFLAAEVIYRNQSVPVMLEEAAVLLSPFTTIVFLVQIKIFERGSPRRLSGFRVRLCQRTAAIDGPEAQARLPECRPRPWMVRDGPEPSREEIERLYDYAVLSDMTLGLNEIQHARLEIPVEAFERFYEIPGIFAELHITVDLERFLEKVCAYANNLVALGLYRD